MSIDLDDQLSAFRPDPQLTTAERDHMLAAVLDSDRHVETASRSHRRRALTVGAVIGLAAAIAVVVPTLLPSKASGGASVAAAAELQRLAVVVSEHRSVILGAQQYWYADQTTTQTGDAQVLFGDAVSRTVTLTTRSQSWTDQRGSLWRQDRSTDRNGRYSVGTYYFPTDGELTYFAALPTDAAALRRYLRSHASGSDSVDEAVFVAIEPILQSGIAPVRLRAAALRVLAETRHVTVDHHAHDRTGRSVERFDFRDAGGRPGTQSIFVDPGSAQVLETSMTAPGSSIVDVVHQARITDSVPAAVRSSAVHQK